MSRKYQVTMTDGSIWDVPVWVIAEDRARRYIHEFGDSVVRSLQDDTLPLFDSDPSEIADWAQNNMNWEDVESRATLVKPATDVDYQDSWVNADWEIVEE